MGNYGQPTAERLITRLRQLNQDVPDNPTAQQLVEIINLALCDQAVCERAIVDGKPKALTFANYWAALYGKWKYVPQEERTRPIEELMGVMK